MTHRNKNMFDEWDEQLDMFTPIRNAFLRFLRAITRMGTLTH